MAEKDKMGKVEEDSPSKFPKRGTTHTLERKSYDWLRQYLPQDWTIDKPSEDYGQDLRIGISEDGEFRGLELIVQLKSSAESNEGKDYESITLKTSTYNYLDGHSPVAMLIKYVDSAKEAYWIKLRDVPRPPQNQATFTVRIAKDNKLSTLDWNEIVTYARKVANIKREARDRAEW